MSELVARTGVSAPTVRYYFAEQLLPAPLRLSSNRFLYDERHVEVVRLIRLLRERRGLSIETIRAMLPELLPDLLGHPEGGVFRPEMWRQVLAVHTRPEVGPSVADRLVAAGIVAFGHRGYGDVSIEDVCRAAGIAKGSFYRHFPSKEELFFTVLRQVALRVVAHLGRFVESGPATGQPPSALLAESLVEYGAIVLDLASLAAQRKPGYSRALRQFIDGLAQAIGDIGPEPGAASPDEVVLKAFALTISLVAVEPVITQLNELQTGDERA